MSHHYEEDPLFADEVYYEDEYEDYDDYDDSETAYSCELRKADNGQLYLFEGWLTRYPGEDWGEASGWSERSLSMNDLMPDTKARCIEIGRGLKPGEEVPFSDEDLDDDGQFDDLDLLDEDDIDPNDPNYIPF